MSRILVYVQHLLGIGHLRRAARIARALVDARFDVVFVTGGAAIAGFDVPGARVVQLPPLTAADGTFRRLLDDAGDTADDAYKARRRALLLATFDASRPNIVMTEMFPFGRRQMRFELEPLLDRALAATPRPTIVASVRDILVPRRPERVAEMVARVQRYYDLVLVHGDPRLIPFADTFPRCAEIADRVRYTGYVVDPAIAVPDAAPRETGEVLVSAGGGAVGARLLTAALAARPRSPLAAAPWRLLTGENLPADQFRALQARAGDGIVVERSRPDFQQLLACCRISLSQGGYNTVLEVLNAGAPAVVVPYESEQAVRCRLLAARGLVHPVDEADLTPATLAEAMGRALRTPLPPMDIEVDGAVRTATLLRECGGGPDD